VAQPSLRRDEVPAADEPRPGDFRVTNRWRYPADLNLGAFEPNRTYLNLGGFRFVDATFLSGADSRGDGRGVLVGDLNGDLQPDLIVRQVGGGALRVYLNRFPRKNRLTVSLRGNRSNSGGIGARVVVTVGGRTLMREMFPANNHVVQQPCRIRFGLGDAKKVDKLVVHWPSGFKGVLTDVPINTHVVVLEGSGKWGVVAVR